MRPWHLQGEDGDEGDSEKQYSGGAWVQSDLGAQACPGSTGNLIVLPSPIKTPDMVMGRHELK